MKYQRYLDYMHRHFSWDRCLNAVCGIYENDRWFRNASFLKTASFCEKNMIQAGLSEVEQLALKADGRTAYGDWVIQRAWNARSARLYPEDHPDIVLADYETTPCSLSMYSAATPPEGVTAEVVTVDEPAQTVDVRGKIIFTGRAPKEVHHLAARGGAIGVVSDFIPLVPGVRNSREEVRNVSRWDCDFIHPKNDAGLWGFSLSPENGERLRSLLQEKGSIRLTAKINAEEFDGVLPTISGCIPGTEPDLEEILVYGHLYEPGANDNASGCALILETARCLAQAVASGQLPRPRRTIRFAMGHECGGSTGYLVSHPERKACLSIVADMVGTEAVDRARLSIWHNPLASWSFMDSALIDLLDRCKNTFEPSFDWEERSFAVGTDNMLGDPAWNMPTIALITEPALSYHSSMDTPDRIEEKVMHRNAMILGTFAMLCADLSEADIPALSQSIRPHADALGVDASSETRSLLQSAAIRAEAELQALATGGQVPCYKEPPLCPESPPGADRIPVRTVRGCLTFAAKSALKECRWQPAWNTELNLPLFWADGKRTMWEIACLSGWESNETDIPARYQWLNEYFETLAEYNYIYWK